MSLPETGAETVDVPAFRQILRALIDHSLHKFIRAEIWPRPAGARRLRIGRDFSLRDIDYFHEMHPIKERMALVQFFESNEYLKSHYSPSDLDIWAPLLTAVLANTEGTEIHERVFDRIFRRYLKELLTPTITWRQLDTITGLKCDFNFRLDNESRVAVLGGWFLRPQLAGQWLDFDHCWLTQEDGVAIITQQTVPREPLRHWDGFRRAAALERSLRILKPGTPRLNAHAVVQVSPFPLRQPFTFCSDQGHTRTFEPEVTLGRRDVREVVQLWKDDTAGWPQVRRADTRLDLARGRFFSTYGEGTWIQHVLDLTIAIEALIGPKSEGELSYRLATRAAQLLGRRGDPDQRVYTMVKTMYDARSKTVHGTPGDESLHAKWLSKISGKPHRWEEGTFKLAVPAVEEARSVVRSLLVGCGRIAETQGKGANIRWPLPDDFEHQMMDVKRRRDWQKLFPPRVVAASDEP